MPKGATSQLTDKVFTKGGLFRAANNFPEYKSLRRAAVIVKPMLRLVTALVSTSLLVRCGDIELNPGPLSKEGK